MYSKLLRRYWFILAQHILRSLFSIDKEKFPPPMAEGGGTRRRRSGICHSVLRPVASPWLSEHDFDTVAAFIFFLVVFYQFSAEFPSQNAGFDPFLLQGVPEPVGVIVPVCQNP